MPIAPAPPTLADRVHELLERRDAQGLGGGSLAYLAMMLKARPDDVERALADATRFDRIATSSTTWWWTIAAMDRRGLRRKL